MGSMSLLFALFCRALNRGFLKSILRHFSCVRWFLLIGCNVFGVVFFPPIALAGGLPLITVEGSHAIVSKYEDACPEFMGWVNSRNTDPKEMIVGASFKRLVFDDIQPDKRIATGFVSAICNFTKANGNSYSRSVVTALCQWTQDSKPGPFFYTSNGECDCKQGYVYKRTAAPQHGTCVPLDFDVDKRESPPQECQPGRGNPIYPLTGEKVHVQDIGLRLAGFDFKMHYRSGVARYSKAPDMYESRESILGDAWFANWQRDLVGYPGSSPLVKIHRLDGSVASFAKSGLGWSPKSDHRTDRIEAGGDLLGKGIYSRELFYIDRLGLVFSEYGDMLSDLKSFRFASGMVIYVDRSSGLADKIRDPFDRGIGFYYKDLSNNVGVQTVLSDIQDPQGQFLRIGFDESKSILKSIQWQNETQMSFVYDSPHPNQAWALTGIIDESGKRYATFGYDPEGRAIRTEHAGGVEKYSVTYPGGNGPNVINTEIFNDTSTRVSRYRDWSVDVPPVVTGPNGAVETFNPPDLTLKYPRDTGRTQPAGAGCAASSSKIEYDANGNKALEDDFNGNRTCFVSTGTNEGGSVSIPNLLKVKVEGLVGSTGASAGSTPTTCSDVTDEGDVLSTTTHPGIRKTSTQWHPQWALKIKEAQPNLIITWVYNGQPDPFNGGATAYCVTPQYGWSNSIRPKLPDGKDTAVLCKKVEQATTDATGEKGFTATLTTVGDVKQRQWTYTYNQYGQVLTSTDPMGQKTTYTYRCEGQATCDGTNKFVFTGTAPNEVGYYQGDLWKVTNAAGHVTEYVSYDRAGRVLEMKDANGLQTKLSYSPRGWVTEVNTAGLKTSYEYWPTGLLKKSTQPDGSYLYYRYDDAHRLTSVTDQVNADGNPTGNTVTYTLDNMGNRKSEQLNDAGNVITRHIQRDYDALNRLKSISGAVQ